MVSKPTNPVYQTTLGTAYGTVVVYPLNENGGIITKDYSPNNNNCNFPGAPFNPVWSTDGLIFDGNDDYISSSDIALCGSNDQATILVRFKYATSPIQIIGMLLDAEWVIWGIGLGVYNTGELILLLSGARSSVVSTVAIPDLSIWHNVAVTFNNGTITFYLDGVLLGTPQVGLDEWDSGQFGPIFLGNFYDMAGAPSNATIAYASYHNKELTPTQIADWNSDPYLLVREQIPPEIRVSTVQKPNKYPLTKTKIKEFSTFTGARLL